MRCTPKLNTFGGAFFMGIRKIFQNGQTEPEGVCVYAELVRLVRNKKTPSKLREFFVFWRIFIFPDLF